jgi:hypothetical protein
LAASRSLIITQPSAVHESGHVLCKLFTQIALAHDTRLSIDWNQSIQIPLSDETFVDLTPDLAFAELDVTPKYRILFEYKWTQPDDDLLSKVADWFELEDVLAVICLRIEEGGRFRSPAPPDDDYLVKTKDEFLAAVHGTPSLAALVFEEYTWVHGVQAITLDIHHRTQAMEQYVQSSVSQQFHFSDSIPGYRA